MPLLSNRWYEQLALFEVHKSNDFYCILIFYKKKFFLKMFAAQDLWWKIHLLMLQQMLETNWPWYFCLVSMSILIFPFSKQYDLGIYSWFQLQIISSFFRLLETELTLAFIFIWFQFPILCFMERSLKMKMCFDQWARIVAEIWNIWIRTVFTSNHLWFRSDNCKKLFRFV